MDKQKEYVILGVDPGTVVTGYGVIKLVGGKLFPLDYGAIRPPAKGQVEEKYLAIFEGIEDLAQRFSPDALSVETQFVHKNIQSAIKLGMARGVVMVAAAKKGVAVHHYAPTKAKLAVVGNGKASKAQVQFMIRHLLGLKCDPQPEDAADALALAVCHANHLMSGKCLNSYAAC